MVSVCAILSIWHNEWDLQDETSLLKSFPYLQNTLLTMRDTLDFSCNCLTLKTAVCTGRSAVMCCFDPLTMWTWRMSCACGSASTRQPRTCTMSHSLASVISPTDFVDAWWILWANDRMIWHKLMLQDAVPASLPHRSCAVPFAWHV